MRLPIIKHISWRWLGGTIGVIGLVGWVAISSQHRPNNLAEASAWVASRHPTIPHLTASQLVALPADTYLLVDARSMAEWSVSHLPGAFRNELPSLVVVEAHRLRYNHIVAYCSIGERSSRLAEQVKTMEPLMQVHDLAGGIFTWACDNLPMVDATGQPTRLVHPYDSTWGALLPLDRRASLAKGGP